jgi:hypothetical protein
MSDQNSGAIDVIVRKDADESTDRADFIRLSDYLYVKKVSLPADDLAANVRAFVGNIQGILENPPEDSGTFRVTSITVAAEISATGKLNILGTGGEITGKGGITFVFMRK